MLEELTRCSAASGRGQGAGGRDRAAGALLAGQSASDLQGSPMGKGHINLGNIFLRVSMF